jgi:predicted DNA-binding transcriptional regulator AlpA
MSDDKRLFITPAQCARLLGVCRASIYNYLAANSIPCFQFKGKTLISRESLNALFDGSHLYQLRPAKEKQPTTEFYTTKEVLEKFGISNSWLFKAAKENNFPKFIQRGKTLWSKPHIDRFFAKSAPKEDISDWYTAAEIQERYGMTLSAIYSLVSKERIPKKKVGCEARYSKWHFDKAKGVAVNEPDTYTMQEAMAKYSMTRDQLYHYIKTYCISKVKVGRIIKISKQELDNLFAPPTI